MDLTSFQMLLGLLIENIFAIKFIKCDKNSTEISVRSSNDIFLFVSFSCTLRGCVKNSKTIFEDHLLFL